MCKTHLMLTLNQRTPGYLGMAVNGADIDNDGDDDIVVTAAEPRECL